MASRTSPPKPGGGLDPALPQKKRARRRIVGAAVVSLAAAIVLPIVLDSEPRQIRGDVQVQIPSRDAPVSEPLRAARSGVIAAAPADASSATDAAGSQDTRAADAAPVVAAGADTKPADDAGGKVEASAKEASAKDSLAKDSAAKDAAAPVAMAAKDSSSPESKDAADGAAKPATKPGPFALQVGAYASDKGANEQVDRLRRAGFKAYTERVTTSRGERIRVRLGPYASRESADAARTKLRAAGVESALIAP